MGFRFRKAHVTLLRATFCLPVLGVKKSPSSPLYTTLGVITKGMLTEVNVGKLGLVTREVRFFGGNMPRLQTVLKMMDA